MTKIEWWIAALVVAVLVHALVPRYDWRPIGSEGASYVRIDRWTGDATIGMFYNKDQNHLSGHWKSLVELGAPAR